MKAYLKTFFLILSVVLITHQTTAQDLTKTHRDSLNRIVTKYYDLNLNIF